MNSSIVKFLKEHSFFKTHKKKTLKLKNQHLKKTKTLNLKNKHFKKVKSLKF